MNMTELLPRVLIWTRLINRHNGERSVFEDLLCQRYPSINVACIDKETKLEHFKEELESAQVFIGDASEFHQVIPFTKSLEWFQLGSAGVDKLMKQVRASNETPQYPFKVTRLGGTYHTAIAEYVIGHIISKERQFEEMREEQKLKSWNPKYESYRILKELTIGIVGAGDIGVEVARCCKCFGMKTIGLSRRRKSKEQTSPYLDINLHSSELSKLLAESDYICSILPASPETDNFFHGDTFSHCTKKPVFINVGRGNCVQEDTIINSIRNGWLSAAIIDVTDPEPLPKESKLWTVPEVTITPHVSGYASEAVMYHAFAKNFEKFLEKKTLDYELDFNKGY